MTTTYSTLDEELNQDATCPTETLDIDEAESFLPQGHRTMRTISINPSRAKEMDFRCAYITLMTYGAISIFFSIMGIIGFGLAYCAWDDHKNGDPRNGFVMAVVSFIFSTLSYFVPVILIVLMTEGVIDLSSLDISI